MKKTAVSILLIFTLLALCSCSVLPKAKNGMKSVTNNAVDFRFECPADWETTRNDAMITVKAPKDNSNISITSFDLGKSNQAVNEYFDSYKKAFTSAFGKMNVLSDEETKLDSVPARKITYTNTLVDDKYKSDMLVCIRNGVVYTITYTATPDTYDTNHKAFNHVKNTFIFK